MVTSTRTAGPLIAAIVLLAPSFGVSQVAISLAVNAPLAFGQLVAGTSAGTVSIGTGGVRTASGGVTLGNGTTASAARFTVSGAANTTYAITLPTSATLESGAHTMTLDSLVSDPSNTGLLSAAGQQPLSIGATLHVSAGQPPGSYVGTLLVTVSYN